MYLSLLQTYQCCLIYRSISILSGILRSCRSLWRMTITSKIILTKYTKTVGQLIWTPSFCLIVSYLVTGTNYFLFPFSNYIVCCWQNGHLFFPKIFQLHVIIFVMRNSEKEFKLMDPSMFFFCCFIVIRLSQKIEPGTSTPRANASKEDLDGKLNVTCRIKPVFSSLYLNSSSFLNCLQARKRRHLLSVAVNVQ